MDDTFTRVSDLGDEQSVFGADLFYHKCLENYLLRYIHAVAYKSGNSDIRFAK